MVNWTVESMKEWVRKEAKRDGPCWGDVPKIPDAVSYNFPTY